MHTRAGSAFTRLRRAITTDGARSVPCMRGLAAVTVALLLCACDAEPETPAPPAGTASPADTSAGQPAAAVDSDTSDTETTGALEEVSWIVGTTTVEREVAGAALLRGVRTARHEGFDRIVLDFGADAVPSYHIEYVDRPVRQCGSGDAVPLAGDAWLSIRVEPANAHTEAGEPTVRMRERTVNLPTLLELKMICDFEAQVEWVAGVSSPEGYRALTLTGPNRLVVDIRHRATR